MEGQFLKMPNGQEGNHFARKHRYLSDEKFNNLKDDREKREIIENVGRAWSHIGQYEIKKTPRQRELISFVVDAVNELLKEYGQEGKEASIDLVKIVKQEFFKKNDSDRSSAVYLDYLQAIAINDGKKLSDTAFAESVFHEFMHLFSFQRSVVKGGNSEGYADLRNERLGLSIRTNEFREDGEDKSYFNYINEAIVTELCIRFQKKMRESDFFKKDFWLLRQKYGAHDKSNAILRMDRNADGSEEPVSIFAYRDEHRRTMDTLKIIYEKNNDKFSSPDDVFEFFAKAHFSGRLLPVARLIEKTFGKGSFRGIGEESSK